jgi:L-threonylcarbamoyladenylate synthase
MARLSVADAAALERTVAGGGIVVFPADTVYGLGCQADDADAAARIYELKGRPPAKPAAVMFFDLARALPVLVEAGPKAAAAAAVLLPGAVTVLVPNPQRRFAAACGPDPATLGIRVPRLPAPLQALQGIAEPLLQTSANLAGEADARLLEQIPRSIRDGADLVLDGGELAGRASTVVDLRGLECGGGWRIVREGAIAAARIEQLLGP